MRWSATDYERFNFFNELLEQYELCQSESREFPVTRGLVLSFCRSDKERRFVVNAIKSIDSGEIPHTPPKEMEEIRRAARKMIMRVEAERLRPLVERYFFLFTFAASVPP